MVHITIKLDCLFTSRADWITVSSICDDLFLIHNDTLKNQQPASFKMFAICFFQWYLESVYPLYCISMSLFELFQNGSFIAF